MTHSVPDDINGARVVCYSRIDSRHRSTGGTRHFVDGVLQGAAKGLAICRYVGETGFYLFGCNSNWETVTDTFHQSLDEAQAQAEFEYQGISDSWQYPSGQPDSE